LEALGPLELQTNMKEMSRVYKEKCTKYGAQESVQLVALMQTQELSDSPKAIDEVCIADQPTAKGVIGAQGARAIFETWMERVYINGDKGGKSEYESLTSLYIYKALISDDGATACARFLRSPVSKNLLHIDLLDNNISVVGAIELGRALKSNQTLQSLALDHNPLANVGAIALCDNLKYNGFLLRLSLNYCNIGADGGKAIAEVLAGKSSECRIEEMVLQGNVLGSEGLVNVVEGLGTNTMLKVRRG
jgi:hypothetical protein